MTKKHRIRSILGVPQFSYTKTYGGDSIVSGITVTRHWSGELIPWTLWPTVRRFLLRTTWGQADWMITCLVNAKVSLSFVMHSAAWTAVADDWCVASCWSIPDWRVTGTTWFLLTWLGGQEPACPVQYRDNGQLVMDLQLVGAVKFKDHCSRKLHHIPLLSLLSHFPRTECTLKPSYT